jgi:SEC-C motif domain protein
MTETTTLCPCGTNQEYSACCEPRIRGTRPAETAEALMRSRYSAFVKKEIDYILLTVVPDQRKKVDRTTVEQWSTHSTWKQFEILSKSNGEANDSEGYVEFVARYAFGEVAQEHREKSHFVKKDGRWYFDPARSKQPGLEPAHKVDVGRNDPCPCGSGQKYKKCCGKAA